MKKRSISLFSHRTSITLEEPFWDALHEIAKTKEISIQKLIEHIDEQHLNKNLSSQIRIYILNFYKK